MKNKKVASICRRRKRATIYHAPDGTQYISPGMAAYAAYNMPKLAQDSLLAIFDVKKDDWGKWDVLLEGMPQGISFADEVPGEKLVERFPLPIVQNGHVLLPVMTTKGVIFIDNEYLAPLSDAPFGVELYERHGGVGTYIAVKAGFDLVAVILPEAVINQTFVELLSTLNNACAYRLQAAQAEGAESELLDQYSFEEDEG